MLAKSCIPDETGMDPLEAAKFFIERLREPAHVLVAISGGSDSTGLLLALHEALAGLSRKRVRLSAVTVDHALRPESADEARRVAALCSDLGVYHAVRRWDEPKPASGLSDASRLARYRLIADVADTVGADAIVTGHTSGDQRETVAMRAARSDRNDSIGLSGMAEAMLYEGRHWIMRPFLRCERQAIRDYLLSRETRWIDDPSNENSRYERVRVRQALDAAPCVLPSGISERRAQLSEEAAEWLRTHVSVSHSVLARIDLDAADPASPACRHALSALLAVLGGRAYFPSATGMDRAMAFIASGTSGRMTLGRVLIDRRRDALYLFRERRNLPVTVVAPGASGTWDDRFIIRNCSHQQVQVIPSIWGEGSSLIFPAVPSAVVRQVVSAMPDIVASDGVAVIGAEEVAVTPRLAPFDLFLPQFDLELANGIAGLFGRPGYSQPPV